MTRSTPIPTNPDVVVVGAGTAGLAAAKLLMSEGKSVVVLEAAPHIGGRCVCDNGTFPIPFDRGGSWLHAAEINPLARIAEDRGYKLHKRAWDWKVVHGEGRDLNQDEVAQYARLQKDLWTVISAAGRKEPDQSAASAMPATPFQTTLYHGLSQMLGGEGMEASALDSGLYEDGEGDWLVEGGLGNFIAQLHVDVPVVVDCPVARIDYGGKGVRVDCAKGTIAAQSVIVTASTGVLAAGKIAFNPPLPDEKLTALDALPLGLLNKVGLQFSPDWSGAGAGDIADYHPGGAAFSSVFFGFYESELAVGFLSGDCADDLESQGPGAATQFCIEGLRKQFGSDVEKSILKTTETAWRGEPLAMGAYSYARVGKAGAREILAQPVADRVFFAGEATNSKAFATVHGAYQSGQRAAREVLDRLEQHAD